MGLNSQGRMPGSHPDPEQQSFESCSFRVFGLHRCNGKSSELDRLCVERLRKTEKRDDMR
jgi:hypothetical protein